MILAAGGYNSSMQKYTIYICSLLPLLPIAYFITKELALVMLAAHSLIIKGKVADHTIIQVG